MGLPDLNPGGYVNASIANVTGWDNVDYLLAHGRYVLPFLPRWHESFCQVLTGRVCVDSGDDNVHFANTAHLLE